MNDFQTIDVLSLDLVTGGADAGPTCGPNQTRANGDLQVKTPLGLEVKGQGAYESCRTNYAECLSTLAGKGATPEQIKSACGTPSGGN